MELRADGVFLRELQRPGNPPASPADLARVLPPPPSAAALGSPNPSPATLRWTYSNAAGIPWISQSASVGKRGALAWFGQSTNGHRLSLLSCTDDATPVAPEYEDLYSSPASLEVAAADRGWGCGVTRKNSDGTADLLYYEGTSSTPAITAVTIGQGFFEVDLSDAGSRAAVGFTDASGNPTVEVYDTTNAAGSPPIATLTPAGAAATFRHHALSGDGEVVLLASGTTNYVYQVATGALRQQDSTTVSHDAHCIDASGDTWARGGFDVGVWKWNGSSYSRTLTFNDLGLGFAVYTACGVSADGSTFVAAAYDATSSEAMRVYCFDLTPSSASLRWTYASNGSGSLQDVPRAVELSDDGRWIGVGSWGGEFSPHPEALLFDRDAGNVPAQAVDTPGSVFDLDLGGDGQFLVCGTKSVHANVFGNGGESYSFDRGSQGCAQVGTARLLNPFHLRIGGTPGELTLLMGSLGLLDVPLPAAGFNNPFLLDATLFALLPTPIGLIPGSGVLQAPAMVTVTSAIGLTVHLQSARLGAVNTLDNQIPVSVLP
jgi:hypothetical protein